MEHTDKSFVAFVGTDLLGRGALVEVARRVKARHDAGTTERLAVFDEDTGRPVDIELSGSEAEVLARVDQPVARTPGRPKLGVVSREVSLLPRHWSWLAQQRGGASASMRRLVDAARKANASEERAGRAIDAAHRFMWDIAGDQPNFEEATRALFARDLDELERRSASWPEGIREQLLRFVGGARPE